MELNVLNKTGKETGKKVILADDIFGIEPNDHVIYLDVKQYLANKRQGTHKAKERGEVVGSTRKIKRQKGTGTARAGSIKSPVLRGGGRVFGPRPRDYSFKLNKKVKQLARKSAFSYKASANNILVVEDFDLQAPKTKEFVDFKNNLKINDKKLLLVLSNENKNIYLSARNLKKLKVLTVSQLNTYDVLNSETMVLTESSIDRINQVFGINQEK
ncbi:MAG: 50S ribosomal protein L4 [Bacteroidetes bacterium]|nr:50S ribosomal protein L4 [Bacteroidales bacterium]RLD53029.1 MAG: 50S ribosomal protein L4 [Bacteroidota bacterium]